MSIPLDVNGVVFQYPVTLDEDWGEEATAWAQAVTDGMLQLQGGSFPITADINFGPNFGLLAKYFSTRSALPSTVGTIRLSNADLGIGWRNFANSGNLILTTNASDQLLYNGFPIATSGGGAVTSITGTANQIIASSPSGAVTLSTPQDIAPTSSPTFASLTLTAPLSIANGGTGQTSFGVGALSSNGTTLTSGTLAVTNGGTGTTTSTGTGSVVLSSSPTINSANLITPALGTPSSGVLTNATGLPIDAGTVGTLPVARGGTGTTTSTGTGSVVLSNSPTLVTPNLGTPSAVVLTNGTGLPLTTGVTGILPNANTTATSSPTASTIVSRDTNANTRVNALTQNFTTTVTAAGTTNLTAASSPIQQFTGTTTQTVTLPDATTLFTGYQITVLNRSTGVVTVNNFGGVSQQGMNGSTQTTFTCTNTGTSNGTWDVSTSSATGGSTTNQNDFIVGTASGTYTGSLTVFDTSFAFTQDNKNLEVYYDGVKLTPTSDYTETLSTRITTTVSLVAGRKITLRSVSAVGNAAALSWYRENYVVGTASGSYTGSLTTFNLTNTYTPGGTNLAVYLDGDLQTVGGGADYVETNPTTVTFNTALVAGQTVAFIFSQTAATSAGIVNSGNAGEFAIYSATGAQVSSLTGPAGNRNRFINGDMTVDQKNGGVSATANNATLAYVPSMFLLLSNFGGALEGVMSIQQLTASPPTGFTHYARVTVTTADASISAANAYEYLSAIEGNNVKDLLFGTASAKTVALSFWVRSSLTGTFGGGVVNEAQDRSYVFQYTINSANTWERKTISIPGDTGGTWVTGTGRGVQLFWDMGSGTNAEGTPNTWNTSSPARWRASGNVTFISTNAATWDLTGVQFELGSTATTFEYLTPQTNIFNCERYYEKSYPIGTKPGTATDLGKFTIGGSSDGGSSVAFYLRFRVPKRVTPTFTFYTGAGTSGSIAYARSGASGTVTTTGGGGTSTNGTNAGTASVGATWVPVQVEGHWTADAELQ